jgi:hypothetical protein
MLILTQQRLRRVEGLLWWRHAKEDRSHQLGLEKEVGTARVRGAAKEGGVARASGPRPGLVILCKGWELHHTPNVWGVCHVYSHSEHVVQERYYNTRKLGYD